MKSVAKVGAIVIGIIGVIIIAGLAVGVSMGYFYGGVKQPAQTVLLQSVACSAQDIEKYNQFVTDFSSTEAEQDEKAASMRAFAEELAGKAGYQDDPTCRFIAYAAAVTSLDQSGAQAELDAIKALSEKGLFPSNELLDVASIESMQARIDGIGDVNELGSEQLGSG